MANVTETPSYDAGIYQIETTDPVLGGPNGIANTQAKGLANRTAFLKLQIDQLNSGQLAPAWIASQSYVQEQLQKLDAKQSVRAATVANITLSGVQTIDGVALTVGDRVLVKDQTAADQNGIYLVAAQGWTRATDADNGAKLTSGARIPVEEGAVNSGKVWYLANTGPISIGTSVLVFVDERAIATETVPGPMKIATQSQADSGVAGDVAVTPKVLKAVLSALGLTKYGAPMIGVPIDWPLAQMPQDIWPDCGMVFLSCAGQSFNKTTYPIAAQLYPSGVMTEIRGEFVRAWDNGRGVDAGRQLLSWMPDSLKAHAHTLTGWGRSVFDTTGGSLLHGMDNPTPGTNATLDFPVSGGGPETAPRSLAFHKIMRVG